jgi:hypothetical protein
MRRWLLVEAFDAPLGCAIPHSHPRELAHRALRTSISRTRKKTISQWISYLPEDCIRTIASLAEYYHYVHYRTEGRW